MKEEDSSTDTSEAEGLGRFVEVVAALSQTHQCLAHRSSLEMSRYMCRSLPDKKEERQLIVESGGPSW